MVFTDTGLIELAKALNGESNTIPSHVAFSSTVITPDTADTSIPGELDRSATSGTRVTNQVTFNALRSGATASSTGDYINTLGLFTSTSGGNLYAEALVPSVLHTTTFDLEIDWKVTIERK